ncbi:UNVERIFIED_CONTAM: hypothetical protein Sradi_4066600 [Sesamum radiatum]|uniref:Uncharacterized protein n=1 Tax=Sesamum radiatum TaxID=300843 RepID=A0AAW2PK07_SESRA
MSLIISMAAINGSSSWHKNRQHDGGDNDGYDYAPAAAYSTEGDGDDDDGDYDYAPAA